MFVAFVAVLVALLAVGVAGWAVHRANVAVEAAGRPAPAPVTNDPATEPPATPDPAAATETAPPEVDPTSTGTPTIDPEANFEIAYDKELMNIQVNQGGTRGIDLDKPSVDADPDVTLQGQSLAGTTNMQLGDGVTGAPAETTDVTPKECLNRIRLSPLDAAAEYPLRKGQVFCLLTSSGDAQAKGETRKLVVLSVAGISEDRVASIEATAYTVPK